MNDNRNSIKILIILIPIILAIFLSHWSMTNNMNQ
ncbi:unnamed protein product, partial [marine sediment metagenome]